MAKQLELVPQMSHGETTTHLCNHAVSWLMRMLSASLQGYRVEATPTEDPYVRRTNIMLRIFVDAPGKARARHAMSYNWYHKDKLHIVQRRLENRIASFAERIGLKLKSPKQLDRQVKERTHRAKRMAELDARRVPDADQRMAQALRDLAEIL